MLPACWLSRPRGRAPFKALPSQCPVFPPYAGAPFVGHASLLLYLGYVDIPGMSA